MYPLSQAQVGNLPGLLGETPNTPFEKQKILRTKFFRGNPLIPLIKKTKPQNISGKK
jgi:hypothetical protein